MRAYNEKREKLCGRVRENNRNKEWPELQPNRMKIVLSDRQLKGKAVDNIKMTK